MFAEKSLQKRSGLLRAVGQLPGFLHLSERPREPAAEQTRISGFLVMPLLLLTAWSGGGLYAIVKALPYLPQMVFDAIGNDWITVLRVMGALAIVAFSLYCLVRFVQRKRAVPRLLVGFFGMLIAVSAVVGIWHPLHVHVFAGGLAAASAGMIVYFLTSSRVKKTFVR
jgi:hypothetical protein